jgi:hypothetical protein
MEAHHLKYVILLAAACLVGISSAEISGEKKGKALSFFNVVRFPNDVCAGGNSRNGTCYTAEECEDRTGVASGTCADGFGVCCIIQLTCGQTSSENCTYLVQTSTTTPDQNCKYTLCPASSNICRMRLDFTVFDIAQPYKFDIINPQVVNTGGFTSGGAVGDCVTDSFVLSSFGNIGSPMICGFNTNQHMIVDAGRQCATAAFSFSTTAVTRQWDIKVTQYECQSEMGGPPGCLQYYTGTSGKTSSFNFPTATALLLATGTTVANPTHLSNQNYDICFRRASGNCAICFIPSITFGIAAANAAITISSFGLSVSDVQAKTDVSCTTDYLIIRQATSKAIAIKQSEAIAGTDRLCGRHFAYTDGQTHTRYADADLNSVCTSHRPFKITFKTDANEVATGAFNTPELNELDTWPAGIVGFSLNFVQHKCV